MPFDYPAHSDLLIHWTGGDFDPWKPKLEGGDSSTTTPELEEKYLKRLYDILKFGFWMKESAENIKLGDLDLPAPKVARLCFTEHRLSHSRKHAGEYGRLGIGVKRRYVFERGGRPVAYYRKRAPSRKPDWAVDDPFLRTCEGFLKDDRRLLHFFKPMGLGLGYELYEESEWRILYSDGLQKLPDYCRAIDPKKSKAGRIKQYVAGLSDEPQYLLPLDGWFACIIYPSLSLKNKVQQSKGRQCQRIRREIRKLKARKGDSGNEVEGGNWPVELDLDLCRNL